MRLISDYQRDLKKFLFRNMFTGSVRPSWTEKAEVMKNIETISCWTAMDSCSMNWTDNRQLAII